MGTFVTLAVEFAPKEVVELALRAARAIGNGLYGVDIKETPYGLMVMEVNDNPNIDAGVEDQILKGALYERVMDVFYDRLQQQRS
jgi:glutathione synthase/RimK-type ligase-like ATP-grasp enzyme